MISQGHRKSLHIRLLLVVVGALALAIILSGIPILLYGKLSAERFSERNLTVIAEILAEKTAFPLSLGRDYAAEAEEALSSARHYEDFTKVCLYNSDGGLVGQYLGPIKDSNCFDSFITNTITIHRGLSTHVLLPVVYEADIVGHIIIESKGIKLQQLLGTLAFIISLCVVLAMTAAVLFGSRQIRMALRDLGNLRETGTKIAESPFSTERAEKRKNDEVGDLVDTFNLMLDALEIENRKLSNSENTFRTLSENAPVGVFLRTSSTNFEFVNNTWSEMTGLTFQKANCFTNHIGTEYKRDYIENIASLKTNKKFVVTEFEYLHEQSKEFRFLQEYVSVFKDEKHSYYIGTLIDVTALKHSQRELENLAYFDPLTKLPNRRFLSDHLSYTFAAAEKKHDKIAVFMTDLDNFKRINDTQGHDTGDQLLENIGDRLKKAVFKEDVVCRMGGDEFLILVDGIENLNSIEFISKRLLTAMRTYAGQSGSSLSVTGSIGVAIYPDDSNSAEELMRHADIALYHSKANGGDQFSCYSESLDIAIREQVRIEQKLSQALLQKKIEVHLQPQILAAEGRICWAEALVRWHDDEEGFISPAKFIPIAEDTGLIIELGRCVIEQVCIALCDHKEQLEGLGIKGVSINLSARQFFSDSLVHDIKTLFKKYRIAAETVEFELTESTVTDNIETAIKIMHKIRDLGCRLSIDDFGTGYSSLSYLSKFPITSLKIDRSFVEKLPGSKNDEEIARTIIILAHNLGMSVVAEGVETIEQVTYLREHGCEYLQGYYFAKPASIPELIAKGRLNLRPKKSSKL